MAAPGPGQSFLFLQPGFTQAIYGVAVMATGAGMAGPAFAPNGDPLVVECVTPLHDRPLIRFLGASTTIVNSTVIHDTMTLPSNGGCGLMNHPNGALYTATDRGVVKLDANTGAPLLGPFGGPGLSTGIAVDPQTGNLVFQSGTGGFDFGTISAVDPALTTLSTFSKVFFGNSIISAMAFDPTGNYLFVSTVSPRRVTILNRSGVAVNAVPISSTTARPVGIAIHAGAIVFAVTNNDDGTMTRFDFPGNDFTQPPTQRVFASGGFGGPFPGNGHVQVGPDGCLYLSQGQTRYDNGVVDDTHHHSLVQICARGGVADNITLTPATQHAPAGTPQTVTATVRDVLGVGQSGVSVTFEVTSGPDRGFTFTGLTNTVGQAVFTFSSSIPGTDAVQASFVDVSGNKQVGNPAQVIFTPPPPAAPTGLAATAGNARVSLSWTASSGATSYNVKRATVTGGPYTTIATGVTATTFTDTGLANGTTFFYVVSAVNAGAESPNSNQAQATPTAPQAGVNYVALGDSYSAGQGNPPFLPPTDGPSNFCHRSSAAYSQVLGGIYGLQPKFHACSGAQTSDILTTKWQGTVRCVPGSAANAVGCVLGEPPQINNPGVDPTAALMTLTIGGNNAGFADVLRSCIMQKLWADTTRANPRSRPSDVATWLGLGTDESCVSSPAFVNSANARIDAVFGAAKSTYRVLKNVVSPTGTSIIVADYPHLFVDSPDPNCFELAFVTPADIQYFNAAADRLDNVLQRAAGQAGVNFVDVRPNFSGHGVCSSSGAWINGIDLRSPSGSFSVPPIDGSFHPNGRGQANGYARAIQAYIDSATNRTSQGYPANPTPLPDPPSAIENPSIVVQSLAVQPATLGSAECEGTYQAGQTLSVVGQGFAPGASVQLLITSPGLGPTAEQQVAQVTADSTGDIATTTRIPLAATGFTPPGAQAGLIFADAIGLGPTGAHVDDTAPMKLVPHGSTCGTVEPFPFSGFDPPIKNLPEINAENPGRTIPVKFALAGSNAILTDVLAAGYPQSAPVPCSEAPLLTTEDYLKVLS